MPLRDNDQVGPVQVVRDARPLGAQGSRLMPRKGYAIVSPEHQEWADRQPMVTRCSVHGCDWTHEGTTAEGRDASIAHRAVEHPTAVRAQNQLRRAKAAAKSVGQEPKATDDAADGAASPDTPVSVSPPSPGPAGTEPGSCPTPLTTNEATRLADHFEEMAERFYRQSKDYRRIAEHLAQPRTAARGRGLAA